MSLNQIAFGVVLAVWIIGCVITGWVGRQPSHGTSGGMGLVILTWMFMAATLLAGLIGCALTLLMGGVGYLVALMGLIIVCLWFCNR